MGLHWTVEQCDTAVANDGTVYTIRVMHFGPTAKYIATRSYVEDNGRLWESSIGTFTNRAAAKTACENDAKS